MSVPPRISLEDLLSHSTWVRDLAGALVADPAAADDLVQETWLAAMRRPPDADGSPRPWLARVMQNLARNRWRSEARRGRRERAAARHEVIPGGDDVTVELEMQRVLVDALAELDEPTRSTIVKRYFHAMTAADIAREAGVPESTVRNRLKRGLDALRAKLDRKYGERRAWIALLLPAARRAPVANSTAVLAGGVASAWLAKSIAAAVVVTTGAMWVSTRDSTSVANAVDPEISSVATGEALVSPLDEAAPEYEPRTAIAAIADPEQRVSAPKNVADLVAFLAARIVDADHVPIEGAELVITDRSDLDEIDDDEAPRAVADSAGHVRLDVRPRDRSARRGTSGGLPADEWTIGITITAPGRSIVTSHPRVRDGETTDLGDVVLVPAGSIGGRVVTSDDSELPPKLSVEVVHPDLSFEVLERGHGLSRDSAVASASLAADGTYFVRGVPPGRYRVAIGVEVEGWLEPFSQPIDVRAADVAHVADLVLKKNPTAVSGVVRVPEGIRIRYASLLVRFEGVDPNRDGVWLGQGVDAEGRFSVDLPAGARCDLYAHGSGQTVGNRALLDVPAGTSDLVLALPEPTYISMRAVDEDGDPIPRWSAGITIIDRGTSGGNSGGLSSDSPDGRLSVPVTAVPSMLEASAQGHVAKEFGPFDLAHHPEELEVVLESLAEIRGTVVAAGVPFEGATVELLRVLGSEQAFASCGFPTRLGRLGFARHRESDTVGRFALTEREVGTYVIVARAEGFAAAETGPFRHDPAHETSEHALELWRGGTIEGRVVPAEGAAIAGIVVGVSRGDGFARTVRTDAEGRFRFERLTPGRWSIRRCEEEVDGYCDSRPVRGFDPSLASFDVIDGETTHFELDLRDAECRLRGRLPEAILAGRRWTLTLTPVPHWKGESSQVAEDGRFDVDASVLGRHVLLLADSGDGAREQRIEETVDLARGANEWSLDLPTGTLAGDAPPNALVVHTWTNERGTQCTTRFLAGAAGRFRVPAVPAGKGSIAIAKPVEGDALAVDVPAGGELEVSLR